MVSLQCMADDAELSSMSVLLSVCPTNVTSLTAVDFPNDVHIQLCLPHARENADYIQVVVTILDFARSALVDLGFCLSD